MPDTVYIPSGFSAAAEETEALLLVCGGPSFDWPARLKRIVPREEWDELIRTLLGNRDYCYGNMEYGIRECIAVAALNRADHDPEQVFCVIAHAESMRGILLKRVESVAV